MQPETKLQIKQFAKSVNHWIVIVNVLIFLMTDLILRQSTAEDIVDSLCIGWRAVFEDSEYYRVFTYMFLHNGIEHIFSNMLMIFFLGDMLERHFGKLRYLTLYFLSGILAGLTSIGYNSILAKEVVSVGASGAGFGLMGALLAIMLIRGGKMSQSTIKRMAFYLIASLVIGIISGGVDNAAHIGGFISGLIIGLIFELFLKIRGNRA